MRKLGLLSSVAAMVLWSGGPLPAHEADEALPEDIEVPFDEYDRGAPRQAAHAFRLAIDAADYETAANFIDTRNLFGEAAELPPAELARRLSVIVRRANWVELEDLVSHPMGKDNDGLPPYRDLVGVLLDGDKEVQVLLQRVPRGDGVFIWKVSNATVSQIPKLYETYGYMEIVEDLRAALPEKSFLGLELFKWVVIVAAALVTYLSVLIVALLVRRGLGGPERQTARRTYRFLVLPFGIWLVIIVVNTIGEYMGQGVTTEAIRQWSPVPVLVTVWVLYVGINLLRDVYASRLEAKQRVGAALLLRPAANALKVLVAVAGGLFYLDKVGVDITTVLAGLGVGGVAVALALQKPLEDVFGALTLYTQQPVRVGDFCRVGNHTGTIEEIGLRTTRVRTIANTLIAIPNAQLANAAIDNISARRKILFRPRLRLHYDTSPAQLESVMSGIRNMFASHDEVLEDGQRVRFVEIADDALMIEAYAFLNTTVWTEYLAFAERLTSKSCKSLPMPVRRCHCRHNRCTSSSPNKAIRRCRQRTNRPAGSIQANNSARADARNPKRQYRHACRFRGCRDPAAGRAPGQRCE